MVNWFAPQPANKVRFKALYPIRSMPKKYQLELKKQIRRRLNTYDWRCKLPRPKPRYRLRTAYSFLLNSWVWK